MTRLPRTLALAFGLGAAALIWSATATNDALGVGGSTNAVGYLAAIFYGLFAALVGLVLGLLLRWLLRRRDIGLLAPAWGSWAFIATVVLAAWLWGRHSSTREAERGMPSVIHDQGGFELMSPDDTSATRFAAEQRLAGPLTHDTLTWNGTVIAVNVAGDSLIVSDGDHRIAIDIAGLEGVFRLDALPLRVASEQPTALALAASGAIRSRRLMLVVLDPDWQLIYQHRMLRRGGVTLPRLVGWAGDSTDLLGVLADPERISVWRVVSP